MPNKILKAFEELELYRRKLTEEKLAKSDINSEQTIRDVIPVDPIFNEPILPLRPTINYTDFKHAAMATIKLIPPLHRNLGGVTKVTSNKKFREFILYTHSKHLITISWKHSDTLKRIDEHFRKDSFRIMMIFLNEIKKLDDIHIELTEDPDFKIFKLSLNQVPLLKSMYKENNVQDLKHLRSIREDIIRNPDPRSIQEKEAYRYAIDLISIYNNISIPNRINFNVGYKYKEFEKNERIRVSSKKLPKPKIKPTAPRPVGTCLTITSDRNDRFDHDD